MNMGEPVVGWVEPRLLRKAARRETRLAVLAMLSAFFAVDAVIIKDGVMKAAPWLGVLAAAVMVLFAWRSRRRTLFFRRFLKEGWGALHASRDGDEVILGTPAGLSAGKSRRFPSGDTVALSVASTRWGLRHISNWKITGSGGTLFVASMGVGTDEQWSELATGLQRLGFTVVAEPEAAVSYASATDG